MSGVPAEVEFSADEGGEGGEVVMSVYVKVDIGFPVDEGDGGKEVAMLVLVLGDTAMGP